MENEEGEEKMEELRDTEGGGRRKWRVKRKRRRWWRRESYI